MSPGIPRRVIIGFGLGFLILAVNALIAYQTIVSLRAETRAVEGGLQVMEQLRSVSSAVANSEAGQRSYIITERKEYLEDSGQQLRAAGRRLNDIRTLVGNEPVELEKIGAMQSSIAARTAEFDDALRLLNNGDTQGTLKAISTEQSGRNLGDIYNLFTQLRANQDQLFTQRTRQLQERSQFSLATQYIATFFGLVFLG